MSFCARRRDSHLLCASLGNRKLLLLSKGHPGNGPLSNGPLSNGPLRRRSGHASQAGATGGGGTCGVQHELLLGCLLQSIYYPVPPTKPLLFSSWVRVIFQELPSSCEPKM